MIKVAYFPMLQDDPASFYRMGGVLNYIKHPDLKFLDITQEKAYNWGTLEGASIFVVQRPSTKAHISLINLAKDMNVRIISEWDDDLFSVPVHRNTSIDYDELKKNIKMCLHLSDETWVTTPALRKIYKPYCKNAHIIPNAHNDHIFPISAKMSFKKGKLITYRGGRSHDMDMYQNINDLVKTIGENPDWEFRFLGAGNPEKIGETMFEQLDYRTKGMKNHTYTLPNTLLQFFKLYHNTNSQLAFFPLVTNAFNASKSNISLLEATYAGSCYLGNKQLAEFDHPFVIDISNGLYEPFMEIRDDYARMKRLNFMAFEWMMEEKLLSKINKLRIERLLNG